MASADLLKYAPWSMSKARVAYDCPHAFQLQYVKKIKTKRPSMGTAARVGTAVHAVIEHYLKDKPLDKALKKACIDAKLTSKETTTVAMYRRAIINFKNRWNAYTKKRQASRVAVELSFALTPDFTPTNFWDKNGLLRGKMDLLLITGDQVAIILDHKTGQYSQDFDIFEKYAPQIKFEMLAAIKMYDIKGAKFGFHYPATEEIIWSPGLTSKAEINAYTAWTRDYLEKAAETAATAKLGEKGWYCNYCNYQYTCPHFKK